MTSYIAFCKKEFLENLRTHKLMIMVIAFVFFGLLSPVTARMLPDILSGVDLGGGTIIDLPAATSFDSWAQFFSNVAEMGVLVLVIVFCGIMANELSKGTLVNILTKGMKRHIVILAKFTVATIIWTVSYLLTLGICLGYTIYFWGSEPLPHAVMAFGSLWVFGIFMISIMILGGIVTGNIYGPLVGAAAVVIILNLINIIPAVGRYNPISLAEGPLALLNSSKAPSDFIPALVICTVSILAIMISSIAIFDRKQL